MDSTANHNTDSSLLLRGGDFEYLTEEDRVISVSRYEFSCSSESELSNMDSSDEDGKDDNIESEENNLLSSWTCRNQGQFLFIVCSIFFLPKQIILQYLH